jgi:hypothetical protein
VKASRDWVCVRPATYESAGEAELLKTYFRGRSPELENTTFTLLDPDGEQITRGGRSPGFVWEDAAAMADALEEWAFVHEPSEAFAKRALPTVADLRLGLNVASCDGLPLVVGVAKDGKAVKALREQLASFAWSQGVPGRAHYVIVADTQGLAEFEDFAKGADAYVVQPDAFGRTGRVLGSAKRRDRTFAAKLLEAIGANDPEAKDGRAHVARGRRAGIAWESKLPVTDPGKR